MIMALSPGGHVGETYTTYTNTSSIHQLTMDWSNRRCGGPGLPRAVFANSSRVSSDPSAEIGRRVFWTRSREVSHEILPTLY